MHRHADHTARPQVDELKATNEDLALHIEDYELQRQVGAAAAVYHATASSGGATVVWPPEGGTVPRLVTSDCQAAATSP